MIGSINGFEWVFLIVLALILIGPERLPSYAQQLGRLVRELRKMAQGARDRVREEVGPEMADLADFDPRAYDPRRIIRDAMSDTPPETSSGRSASSPRPVVFDDEAT